MEGILVVRYNVQVSISPDLCGFAFTLKVIHALEEYEQQ